MVFHEQAQRVQPVDFSVNGMVQQCGLERREAFLNLLQSIHRGFLVCDRLRNLIGDFSNTPLVPFGIAGALYVSAHVLPFRATDENC
jgi:hypothetical protein